MLVYLITHQSGPLVESNSCIINLAHLLETFILATLQISHNLVKQNNI